MQNIGQKYHQDAHGGLNESSGVSAGLRFGLIIFFGGFGGGLVFPILPILGVQLGISGAMIGAIMAFNRLTRLIMNPFTGRLVDRIGGKLPLITGLIIEGLSTLLFSLALYSPNPGIWMLLGRGLWGIGSSLLMVGGMTSAINASIHEDRGRVTSLVRSAQSLGIPAGLVLGGMIAGFVSDNAAFLTATALTFTAAGLALWILPPGKSYPQDRTQPNQSNTSVLSSMGIHWTDLLTILKDRRILTVLILNFLIFLTLQGMLMATLVLFLDERNLHLLGLGAQPTTGILMATMMLGAASTTLVVGRLLDGLPYRTGLVFPPIMSLMMGFVLLALSHSVTLAIISLIALGIAMGGTSIPLLTLLGDLIPPEKRGRTVGLYQVFGDAGGSLGPIVGVWSVLNFGFSATYFSLAVLVLVFSPLVYKLFIAERTMVNPKY